MSDNVVGAPEYIQILGLHPNINDHSVQILDRPNNTFYVFGGCRWARNPDMDSPTREPTSDFYMLDLTKTEWTRLTDETRFEALVKLPFLPDGANESTQNTVVAPKPLPALLGAMGHVIHKSDTSYLLLFGGKGRNACNTLSSELICINLTTLIWRKILLDGSRGVARRAGGTMVVAGERLCIFGGWTTPENGPYITLMSDSDDDSDGEYAEDKAYTGLDLCDSYCVADLASGRWVVPNAKMPDFIGPLGCGPGVLSVNEGGKVILLRGEEDYIVATFHTIFIFDPLAMTFEALVTAGDVPSAREAYCFQTCGDDDHSISLIGWNHHEQEESDPEDAFQVRLKPTRNCCMWRFSYDADGHEHVWERMRIPEALEDVDDELSVAYGALTGSRDALVLIGYCRAYSRIPGRLYNAIAVLTDVEP